jgi:hypothetical protein
MFVATIYHTETNVIQLKISNVEIFNCDVLIFKMTTALIVLFFWLNLDLIRKWVGLVLSNPTFVYIYNSRVELNVISG